jgi:putative membrane protein
MNTATQTEADRSARALAVAAIIMIVGLVVSGIGPMDRTTWWLEVAPVLIVLPLLAATRQRFPLTTLLYALITVHALILMLGGHYTYAHVPLGFWVQDLFGLSRNHYDRLGHLAQGFIPAMAAREILVRQLPVLRGTRWLPFLVVTICMAISAFYEFIEWWTALIAGAGATEFLGTQGDVWDTQWDMFLCMCGAILALLTLSRLHDRALARLRP